MSAPIWEELGHDDRKDLASLFQYHCPLPNEGLSSRFYAALIAVANVGYQRARDHVACERMSAVVDAIRAELVEVRVDRAVRAKRLDVSHRSLLAAKADFEMNQGRTSEANRRIDALVSALHLLGERDEERPVEVRDDE